MENQEQFFINKSGSLTVGAAALLDTSDHLVIDSLTWAVWGDNARNGIQLQLQVAGEDYNVLGNSMPDAFVSNTPYNISNGVAPQWEIMDYDTARNKFAFHFTEAPCILPAGCFVGMEHLSQGGEEIFFSVRIRGRKLR